MTLTEREQLEQTIAGLDAQRALLGDAVVDAALAPLRKRLAALSAPAVIEQRKYATVLFADVAGFTAMSETLDSEDVAGLMNALWRRIDAAITQQGGRIDKHIGDAVMALWGVDQVREDDAMRAVHAALAMQAAVSTFATDVKRALSMRIGINTGPVLFSTVGTIGEVTAMGDTVNTASRFEHAAPRGGILIGHSTYRHVRGQFSVEVQSPLTVKGKVKPLQTYCVTGVLPPMFRILTRGVEGVLTGLVGRDAEYAALVATCESALHGPERGTRCVMVVSEAGLGKSRLIEEFDHWLDLHPDYLFYLRGQAAPDGTARPGALWRAVLSARFEIFDSDAVQTVRAKFERGIGAVLGAERVGHARVLGSWLGYDFSESPEVQALSAEPSVLNDCAKLYLSDFCIAAARSSDVKGLVLMLEDLHWADEQSLEALAAVAWQAHVAGVMFCVVAAARPGLYTRMPDWDTRLPTCRRLTLAPLSPQASENLVREILQRAQSVPDALVHLIVQRSEGNPFYIEELVKMLIDDEVIAPSTLGGDIAWRIDMERLDSARVPTTLVGVLQARLDDLPPEQRLALQLASVIGRTFWEQALVGLAQSESVGLYRALDLQSALNVLAARELISPNIQSVFVETREFLFRHALLRDVAYESVLKRERRLYHARAAQWLSTYAAMHGRVDEYAAVIAGHHDYAGENGAASTWYARAGQRALAQYASAEAVRCLTRVIELTPAEDARALCEVLFLRERAYDWQGNRAAQLEDVTRMTALADDLQDTALRTQAALRAAQYAYAVSDYAPALATLHFIIQQSGLRPTEPVIMEAQLLLGRVLYRQGKYEAALATLRWMINAPAAQVPQVMRADALYAAGLVAQQVGDVQGAGAYQREALQMYRGLHHREGEGRCLSVLGALASQSGEYVQAQAAYESALQIFRAMGHRRGESYILGMLGADFMDCGQYVPARRYQEQALGVRRMIGDKWGEAVSLDTLALIDYYLGEYTRAWQQGQLALELQRAIGDESGAAYTLTHLGHVALALADYAGAERAYQQAREMRLLLNETGPVLDDMIGLARVAWVRGDGASARHKALPGLEWLEMQGFTGVEYPLELAWICAQIGQGQATWRARVHALLVRAVAELRQRAERIRDAGLRASFLNAVAAHRGLVHLLETVEREAQAADAQAIAKTEAEPDGTVYKPLDPA